MSFGPGEPDYTVETHESIENRYGRYQIEIRVWGNQYSEYNYIQSASHNFSVYSLDKGWKHNHGFYYDSNELNTYSDNYYREGANSYFEDTPNGYVFDAYVTVCGLKDGTWKAIGTFHWSYIIMERAYSYYQLIDYRFSKHQTNIDRTLNYWNNY